MDKPIEFNHVAFAVKDLDAAMAFMSSIGAELSEKRKFGQKDPTQRDIMADGSGDGTPWKVTYCVGFLNGFKFQIFMPEGDGNPYSAFVKEKGGGIHHVGIDHLKGQIVDVKDDLLALGAEVFSYGYNSEGPKAFYLKAKPLSDAIVELTVN